MAKIIRAVAAFSWLVTTVLVVYLAYSVLQTEANPQVLWSWLVMLSLTFISASFLAYNFIYGGRHADEDETED